MNVLMLSRDDVYSVPGGDTIQMVETRKQLEKNGIHVQVCTVSQIPSSKGYDLVHVFNWEQLDPVLQSSRYTFLYGLPVVLSTIFWFHTGHWFYGTALNKPAWKLLKSTLGENRSRLIYEKWQELKFKRGEQGRKLRRSLFETAQLLPNSVTEIEHLEDVLGVNGSLRKISTVVPNGVVRELYDPLPAPNLNFQREYGLEGFVLEVARIQSAKNQLGLIEALYGTSFPIVFIGQPSPYEGEYVNHCYEAGKRRGNVYFVSPKTPKELAGIYRSASVHVLPSWRETPGLASLEAAAAGCRIVSTSIGSAREYFGNDAWYCDPRDSASIRESMIDAFQSPPSDELRYRVLEHFTWNKAAEITCGVYRKVLNS